MNPDVQRLEAERLRPPPPQLGPLDLLDDLIATLAALCGYPVRAARKETR